MKAFLMRDDDGLPNRRAGECVPEPGRLPVSGKPNEESRGEKPPAGKTVIVTSGNISTRIPSGKLRAPGAYQVGE